MTDAMVHDVVVVGAGSGGYATALRAAQLGLKVALVEADLLGGTCLHRGCIPTKAFLHAAHVADATRHAESVGVKASLEGIDVVAVRAFADGVIGRLHKGLEGLVSAQPITRIAGHGRLEISDGRPGVRVGDELVSGRTVVLATGSRPRTLGLPIDEQRVITSDQALRLESLPQSAIVLGGGVIGVEFASMWASFGVQVTVVEALDRLVAAEEPEVSKALQRAFRKRGITVKTGTAMESVTATEDGASLSVAGGETLTAELVLVAVGREPVSDDVGLAEAGVQTDRGFVVTDATLATTAANVYAVGDLVAGPQLAHRGFAHGLYVAERIAEQLGVAVNRPAPVLDQLIPRVTYSDPEIASVGLTTEQASGQGEVEVTEYNLAGNGRSQIVGTAGFVRLVRLKDGPIVGVHMIGSGVSELIGEGLLITGWQAQPDDFRGLIHAHPSQNEALGEALLALAGSPLHSHH